MKKEFVKKSASYALIPLGVGAGQYLGNLIGDETSSTVADVVILSMFSSILTFSILMIFFPWWESEKSNLGESGPVPVHLSPVLWMPLILVATFLAYRAVNA